MSGLRGQTWVRVLVGAALLLALLPGGFGRASPWRGLEARRAPVDAAALQAVQDGGKATFLVMLKDRADLSAAYEIKDWGERGWAVYNALRRTADESQAELARMLDAEGVDYTRYWVVNALLVTAGAETLDRLRLRPETERILAPPADEAAPQDVKEPAAPPAEPAPEPTAADDIPWNLTRIGADRVWSEFGARGQGIVVADIDSGVQYYHPALLPHYRGYSNGAVDHNYNWGTVRGYPQGYPVDLTGSGTRAVSVIAGTTGTGDALGVAPGARWIALNADCSGYADYECYWLRMIEPAQWILAPTDLSGENARPDLRPHIVSLHMRGYPYFGIDFSSGYVINAWKAAGIFMAFSAGDQGPDCGSLNGSASSMHRDAYVSGAFGLDSRLAAFSSRGTSDYPFYDEIKPNLVAPGASILAASPSGGYETAGSTALAAAHTAGAVALLWSARPDLIGDYEATRALLDQTAESVPTVECTKYPGPELLDPNYDYGEGRLDVYAAAALALEGIPGALHGTVREAAGGAPLKGVLVETSGPAYRQAVTGDDGAFSFAALPDGAYTLTARLVGYTAQSVLVTIAGGQVAQDVLLARRVVHPLAGVVRTNGGEAVPGARVTIDDPDTAPVFSDANGVFNLQASPGAHKLGVDAGGCYSTAEIPLQVAAGMPPLLVRLGTQQDAFGYTCRTTTAEYLEGRPGSDREAGWVNLPFPFPFYDLVLRQVNINPNGFLTLDYLEQQVGNRRIPSALKPNAAIYPFWDELQSGSTGPITIRTALYGSAPQRRFVIEWKNVRPMEWPTAGLDFELVLHESGEIWMQYRNVGATQFAQGGSATIGIEAYEGVDGLQVRYQVPWVRSGLAVRFFHPPGSFVSGRVRRLRSSSPLGFYKSEVSLPALGIKTYSEFWGEYRLWAPAGEQTLEARSGGYFIEQAQITAGVEQYLRRNFRLRPAAQYVDLEELEYFLLLDETKSLPMMLSNPGGGPLSFDLVVEADAPGGWLSVQPASGVIPPGGRVQVNVQASNAGPPPQTHVGWVLVHFGAPLDRWAAVRVQQYSSDRPYLLPEP